jgi:hypothetical protein
VHKQLIAGVMVAAVAFILQGKRTFELHRRDRFGGRGQQGLAVAWGDHVPCGEPLRASSSCCAIATAGTSR